MYLIGSFVCTFIFLVLMEVIMPREEMGNDMEPYWFTRIGGGLLVFFLWIVLIPVAMVAGCIYLVHLAAIRLAQRIQRKLNGKVATN